MFWQTQQRFLMSVNPLIMGNIQERWACLNTSSGKLGLGCILHENGVLTSWLD